MKLIMSARTDEQLQYAAQLGCDGVISGLSPDECRHGYFEYPALVSLKSKVDYRNVRGVVDHFQETFLDNGQENMADVMRAFVEVGYDGPIGPDHAVHLVGDNPRGDRYWAYAIGYMRALLQVLEG
jgi:hypothetical protein